MKEKSTWIELNPSERALKKFPTSQGYGLESLPSGPPADLPQEAASLAGCMSGKQLALMLRAHPFISETETETVGATLSQSSDKIIRMQA